MYWDSQNAKSRDCLFNFILGARGTGKTYRKKIDCINDFLKSGSQFVYMRRYKEEFRLISNFFDDVQDAYPDHEFKYYQGKFYIDEEVCGFTMALSTAKVLKSVSFHKVKTIIFDEFIVDKGYIRYLPDEVTNFLEAYSTIARLRDVKVWFLSNAISVTNPYFIYFGIDMPYGSNFKVKDDILIEIVTDDEHANAAKATRFGKMIKDTDYGAYAIDNKFLRDSSTFVEKKPKTSVYRFTLSYKGKEYGVWLDRTTGIYYFSFDVDTSCKLLYAVTLDDHKPNALLLRSHGYPLFDGLIKRYMCAGVRFESVQLKNICQEIIKLTM